MKETSVLYWILIKLGLKKPIDYSSIAYLRSRRTKIGENANILNSVLTLDTDFLYQLGTT